MGGCFLVLLLRRFHLVDPNRFLSDLKSYDRDNIPDRLIVDIEPFINMPEFEPDVIDRASKACSGICLWVRAMYKYHHVVKLVEPKKRKLAEAQEALDRTMGELNTAKKRLSEVLDRVAALEDEFKATQVRKASCCMVSSLMLRLMKCGWYPCAVTARISGE
jgi:dynein heavy chain, axonemal